MDNLMTIDKTFNEALFITKVNNIFVKLHTAIILNDLESVKHFLNNDVYEKYKRILENLNLHNEQQMFDELNVKKTFIENIEILEDKINITVKIISRYMDYIIDKNTLEYIRGNNTRRIEKNNYLIEEFEEYLGFKIQYPVDIIAASLTMQLLVLQEKINEKVINKGEK